MFEPLPSGPFSIIYADPPWNLNGHHEIGYKEVKEKGRLQTSVAPYPLVRLKDLCKLPVADIAANNSLLFLWVCSPGIPEALTLGEAWGFHYVDVAFVWDKQLPICGAYTMSQIESILLFKRGDYLRAHNQQNITQFLSAKRGKHSAKPLSIRAKIDAMFPHEKKIELFARYGDSDDWVVWGNEAYDDMKRLL